MESENGDVLTVQVHILENIEQSSIQQEHDWWRLSVARRDVRTGEFIQFVDTIAPNTTRLTLNFPTGSGDTKDALAVIALFAKTFYSADISVCGLFTRVFTEKAAWRVIAALPQNVVCIEIPMRKIPEDGVPASAWVAAPNLQDVHVLCQTETSRTHRCFSRAKW